MTASPHVPKYPPQATVPGAVKPLGYVQMGNVSAATPLAPPAGATIAVICAEGQDVRYRDDGKVDAGNLSGNIGFPLAKGTIITIRQADLTAVNFIQQAATAKVNVLFYGPDLQP